MTAPDVDHPEPHSLAEIVHLDEGISVSARVESVADGVLTVQAAASERVDPDLVAPGDRVDVFWRMGTDVRSVPAEVLQVEPGATWRLRVVGRSAAGQRRQAVRGRVVLPVELRAGDLAVTGESVDLSEGGVRVRLAGLEAPLASGAEVALVLQLEEGPFPVAGRVIRCEERAKGWLVSVRFVDLAEKDGDRLRRRVFQALREERARLSG